MRRLWSILLFCLSASFAVSAAEPQNPSYQRLVMMKGAWLFERNCAFCHERDGRGAVGPNLTDWYFIHGPTRENLHAVIEDGVPEKGMPVWKTILKPTDRRLIEQYVWSLRGTQKQGKAPEGELHKPESEGAE
ncbi:MAG: c-type cytochrome [Verrucomicrobiae bacterium]|nr:c-type cytochrome [Verrucomicrobiae bacterium]